MHGTCPKCGHHEKVSIDPGTAKFAKLVVKTAAEISGVTQANVYGRYGVKKYRDVRAAVCRYLRYRGLTWEKCAKALKRNQAADAFAMQNNWYGDYATLVFNGLKAALGDGT